MLHWAPCMGIPAWHPWQFSATSRKCYLMLRRHESSERFWWPCLEWSVPPATQQLGAVSWNRSTKLRCLKCVGQLQLNWWFWYLIYFVAACQCPDKALAATHTPDFFAGPVYLASDLSKAKAFSTPLCSYLNSPQWMCILCLSYLGPWDYNHLAQLPQVLTSSPVGILVKILRFQGRWHAKPCNAQSAQRSLIIVGRIRNQRGRPKHPSLQCFPDRLNYSLGWGWVVPGLHSSSTSTAPLSANPLADPWASKNSGPGDTLLSYQPDCADYVAFSGLFADQRLLPYKQKIAKIQWLSNPGTMSCPLDIILSQK